MFSILYCENNQKSNPKDKDVHVTTIQDWLDELSFFKKNYEAKFCNAFNLFDFTLPKSIKRYLSNIRN